MIDVVAWLNVQWALGWFIHYCIAQGNATQISCRKGTCANGEDCEGLFSPTIPLETS